MSGHSKWSTIKHKKGAADAKRGQALHEALEGDHRRREGGRRRIRPPTSRSRTRSRRRSRYSMPKDTIERAIATRRGHGRRRRGLRDDRLRGLRPGRRGRARRGADRQPQPHGLGRPAHVREERRQPRHDRARSRGSSSGAASCSSTPSPMDEDELTLAAAEGGADDVERRRLRLPGLVRAGEPLCRARRDRGRRHRGRVGRADDDPEDDGRGRGGGRRRRS